MRRRRYVSSRLRSRSCLRFCLSFAIFRTHIKILSIYCHFHSDIGTYHINVEIRTEHEMNSPTLIHAAKFTSIIPAIFISGYTFMASQNAIPQLYDERPHMSTPIFKRIFHAGGKPAIPLSITSLVSSAYLAYQIPEKRHLWAAAAASILAIRIYTQMMMPGINRLIEIADSGTQVQDKVEQTLEHRQLMVRWVKETYVRSVLALGAGLAGLWASI